MHQQILTQLRHGMYESYIEPPVLNIDLLGNK